MSQIFTSYLGQFKNSNKVFAYDDEMSSDRRTQVIQEKYDDNKAMFTLNVTTNLFPKEISFELNTNDLEIVANRNGY